MQWNVEPLGNPFDDVRALQATERHRGEAEEKIKVGLRRAGVLQTDKAKGEAKEFFDNVCDGHHLSEKTKKIIWEDFRGAHKCLRDRRFTFYGGKSIKKELSAFVFFITAPPEILPQFAGNETDLKILREGREIFEKKTTKLLGMSRSPFVSDEYFGLFINNPEKMRASFRDNVPDDVVLNAWKEANPKVVKLRDKVREVNRERLKNDAKGVNLDYLSLLICFYTIKKGNGKILKSFKELASLWSIPLRRLKTKMAFLYRIDI